MKIYIPSFEFNGKIPVKFTCDGINVNPEIQIEDVPPEAKSLVLIVDDPDSPSGNWSHWVVWNINPGMRMVKENGIPDGGITGVNDFLKREYGGPCPFQGEHRYFFKIFALNKALNISDKSTKSDVERAMEGFILEASEYVGRYSRL